MARPVVRLVARMTRGVLEPGSGGHLVRLWWTGHRHQPAGTQLGQGTSCSILWLTLGLHPNMYQCIHRRLATLCYVRQAAVYWRNVVFHLSIQPPWHQSSELCTAAKTSIVLVCHTFNNMNASVPRLGYLLAGNVLDKSPDIFLF